QIRILEAGGRIVQETRLWDAALGQSATMRTKEDANDYRYFPDPDLPPLVIDPALMASVLRSIPELPGPRFERYVQSHNLGPDEARTLIGDRALAEYFDAAVSAHPGERRGKPVANWVLTELLGALNAEGRDIGQSPMPPHRLSALVALVESGTISGKIGKEIFEESYRTGEEPAAIVERRGVQQISDERVLAEIIDRVVASNPKQANEYAAGKDGLFGFFVGRVMKETQGRANPTLTTELLRKRLGR
ncbi:MAG: Asp-tRNA(Asn)/Glu-tRNA(Gln) amidotransferase GatCAB subunit B, partial [Kofleriaceae bacterium]